ncbi:unnamed protein product [Owenia fusiformis]|uniref:Uncharacterized protein n=1 Tax=Owenia fusiformis TaxID=6347 RepID=A0A8J1UBX6_OWEFU|nr:unnamed protein product [Owenia fusiformis]
MEVKKRNGISCFSNIIYKILVLYILTLCLSNTNGYVNVLNHRKNDILTDQPQHYNDHRETPNRLHFVGFDMNNKKRQVAEENMTFEQKMVDRIKYVNFRDAAPYNFNPGDPALSFSIYTTTALDIGLSGSNLVYPGPMINRTTPILFNFKDSRSGFLEVLWGTDAITYLLENGPSNTHYFFIFNDYSPFESLESAILNAKSKLHGVGKNLVLNNRIDKDVLFQIYGRIHFVTLNTYQLGNWIPALVKLWACQDHNCGYYQLKITSEDEKVTGPENIVKRIDGRYDWLPSPLSKVKSDSIPGVYVGFGCNKTDKVKNMIAIVDKAWGDCTQFNIMETMQASGAVAVIVMQGKNEGLEELDCYGNKCGSIGIPGTIIPYVSFLTIGQKVNVTYQTTPSDNFFFGIDGEGNLAEVGWFLYPSFSFLVYQAQWFNYVTELKKNLSEKALVINVCNHTMMQGKGVSIKLDLPPAKELQQYSKFELDLALSCPGHLDTDCPHWDHTVNLYACCLPGCVVGDGVELGRWITPFRRRIGRWLTDISPLLPLIAGNTCVFTLKTAPWAMTWVPSLNLRFTGKTAKGDLYADSIFNLYGPTSYTFDKNYNKDFPIRTFEVPPDTKKTVLVSVITGHGSDNNGCGEFCISSHHFVVNFQHTYNRSFDNAGDQLGCAKEVPRGVEPNEHGTWLYGRGGWCDGQEVSPWNVDISKHVNNFTPNNITYYGWFNGTDPNPTQNPGVMIYQAYVVFYKML